MPNFCTATQFRDVIVEYSVGNANVEENSIINRIAPIVPVQNLSFTYKQYNDTEAFSVQPINLAPGQTPRKTTMTAKDVHGTLKGHGLSIDIEDELLGKDPAAAQATTLAKYKLLESEFVTSYECSRAKVLLNSVSAASGAGGWTDADSDPIADIEAAIERINGKTGKMPNTIVFGLGAWKKLRSNTKARQLVSYNSDGQFNEDLLQKALMCPMNDIFISTMPYMAADGNAKIIMENDVYILFKDESPTEFDSSAVKTFALDGDLKRHIITEYKETEELTVVTTNV